MGYLANCSPSPFGEGWGEAVSGVLQASVELLFRLSEIPLQIIRHYCSQISSLSLKTVFVTYRESVSYKEAAKRCPFALQNMPFYTSKDALLHCKRASFTTQKGVDGKAGRKEIDKRRAELRRNATAKIRPPQAPPKEGMCLAGYGMLWVGEMEGGRNRAKRVFVYS